MTTSTAGTGRLSNRWLLAGERMLAWLESNPNPQTRLVREVAIGDTGG
jgi:hypothetical protein